MGQRFRERGEAGVDGALDQGLQHRAARHPEDVRRHRRQLDTSVLQQLVRPIGGALSLLDQHFAVARQVPELPNRRRRHEAAPQQPVLPQLRDPDAVEDIGLATGDLLDVGGVDEQAREPVLEDVEHGLPVDARAVHRHVRDPEGRPTHR